MYCSLAATKLTDIWLGLQGGRISQLSSTIRSCWRANLLALRTLDEVCQVVVHTIVIETSTILRSTRTANASGYLGYRCPMALGLLASSFDTRDIRAQWLRLEKETRKMAAFAIVPRDCLVERRTKRFLRTCL